MRLLVCSVHGIGGEFGAETAPREPVCFELVRYCCGSIRCPCAHPDAPCIFHPFCTPTSYTPWLCARGHALFICDLINP